MATEHRKWNREMKLHCWKFINLYMMWHDNNKYKTEERPQTAIEMLRGMH